MAEWNPRANELFLRAAELASSAERQRFLERECHGDTNLFAQVESLLAAGANIGSFLERPALPASEQRTITQQPIHLEPRTSVGPYKLLEKIGEGGMGEVWVADQQQPLQRRVALKLIKAGMDSKNVLARFEAERQALAVMDHPNIAKVLDAGTTSDGRPYFVMELVKGTPITEFCDVRKLTPTQRLELFVPICQAIQHAHMKGILHRDIKPSNVLVALHDETPVPKVIDFGVAKAIGQKLTEKTIYTGFGALVGTPAYMAPEQASFNQLDVDTRADVYALGVLLYELLAGSPPIEKERLQQAALDEVLRLVRDEEPPRPSQRLSTSHAKASIAATRQSDPARLSALMRGELDWIVMKTLEKDRTRRYDSANALAKDVQRYLAGDAVEACPPTLGYRFKKAYRRHRTAVLTGGTVALLLLFGIVGTTWGLVWAVRAEQQASRARDAEVVQRTAAVAAAEKSQRAERLQNLTRYAAEMNLLQVAFDSADLPRVEKLLTAQRPQPGDEDLRGPEWHYWNRRLNGHAFELRVPCRVDLSFENVMVTPQVRLSPDGQTMAHCFAEDDGRVLLQLWDVRRQTRTATHTVLPPNKWVGTLFLNAFSPDGKNIIVTRLLYSLTNPDDQKTAYYGVEVGSGRITLLQADETGGIDDVPLSADQVYHHQQMFDPATGQARLEFRRLADGGPAGGITIPEAPGGVEKVLFGPQPNHVLVLVFPDALNRNQLIRRARIAYWKIGSEKPLWQVEIANATTVGNQFQFTADGKSVGWMTLTGDTWRFTFRDLATGKVANGHPPAGYPIVRKSDTTTSFPTLLGSAVPHPFSIALSPDGRRLAVPTPTGCAVYDLGDNELTRPRWGFQSRRTMPTETLTKHHPFDSLEGPPEQLAFQSNERLAVMHSPGLGRTVGGYRERRADPHALVRVLGVPPYATGRAATENLLGHWEQKPTLAGPNGPKQLFAFGCKSRDRTMKQLMDGLNGARLVVLDEKASTVFQSAEGVTVHDIFFSADGRYAYGLDQARGEGNTTANFAVVIWDLVEKRERLRLTPPEGQRYGLPSMTGDGTKLVINVYASPSVKDQPNGPTFQPERVGQNSLRLVSGSVVDLASGRVLFELKPPKGVTIFSFAAHDEAFLGWIKPTGEMKPAAEVVRWDLGTGTYMDRSPVPANVLKKPYAVKWLERGTVAIKDYWVAAEGKSAGPRTIRTVEGWDIHRRGAADQPLWSLSWDDSEVALHLTPDGSRLLVRDLSSGGKTAGDRFARLYCTTTGRELLRLPEGETDVRLWHKQYFGLWSQDGQQFWYGIDSDGKAFGWDFRALPEPKK